MTRCNTGCRYIDDYIASVRAGPSGRRMLLAADWVQKKLETPGVVIDTEKTDKAVELIERYFAMTLFPWELFVLALIHCYEEDGSLVFTEYLIMMGRGNGKNGFISGVAWYLTTHYHGIRSYNVDIVANSEDQAKTSFMDIYDMLGRTWAKSKRFFYRSLAEIRNLKTGSYIRYNTANARTKDGKRSACLIFDELHEYENGDNIEVYTSGFGKRPNSRIFKITTQGHVREGVLDTDLAIADDVLHGELPGSRLCPLLYEMDSDAECNDPALWVKANPSLPYLPNLRRQIEQEAEKKAYDKIVERGFYTKRMNRPRSDAAVQVTEWANIAATDQPIDPALLHGKPCTAGIDYASLRDWASVVLHFKVGAQRYDLHHSWLCLQSPDLSRIKAPWREWAEAGHLTVVDQPEIPAVMITEYLAAQMEQYVVCGAALDNFRFALLSEPLEHLGFTLRGKNLKLVRPSDIMKVQPVIDSCFTNRLFTWGDCPPLRWAANNTKLIRRGKADGTDTGNYYYGKIEGKSRKTDPFMALVAAMTIEQEAPDIPADFALDIIT